MERPMIAEVWRRLYGEDVASGRKVGPDQYRVRCPAHQPDRNPSCDVNVAKDVFFCRSCEAGGGFLDLIVAAGDATDRESAKRWMRQQGFVLHA